MNWQTIKITLMDKINLMAKIILISKISLMRKITLMSIITLMAKIKLMVKMIKMHKITLMARSLPGELPSACQRVRQICAVAAAHPYSLCAWGTKVSDFPIWNMLKACKGWYVEWSHSLVFYSDTLNSFKGAVNLQNQKLSEALAVSLRLLSYFQ